LRFHFRLEFINKKYQLNLFSTKIMAKKNNKSATSPQKQGITQQKNTAVNNPKQLNKITAKTETLSRSQRNEPEQPKEPFQWTKGKILALIPLTLISLTFLLLSFDYGVQVVDPWYKAVQLVDSSRNVSSPVLKQQLLDKGGSQLKELSYKFKHARVQFFLGYYFYQIQQWDSATYYCRAAFKADSGATMNPVWQDALKFYIYSALNQSSVLINKNDLSNALSLLKEIELLYPENADILNDLGIVYTKQKQLPEAAKYFKMAYHNNPKHPEAKNNLMMVYQQMGDLKSLEDLQKQ
jgi:tetratricopeptide (TPR) repeat protein